MKECFCKQDIEVKCGDCGEEYEQLPKGTASKLADVEDALGEAIEKLDYISKFNTTSNTQLAGQALARIKTIMVNHWSPSV